MVLRISPDFRIVSFLSSSGEMGSNDNGRLFSFAYFNTGFVKNIFPLYFLTFLSNKRCAIYVQVTKLYNQLILCFYFLEIYINLFISHFY